VPDRNSSSAGGLELTTIATSPDPDRARHGDEYVPRH
jgi:hypothetical protein